jgi:beta-glucosidase
MNKLLLASMITSISFAIYADETRQNELNGKSINILDIEGYNFKDLNRNGVLDPYEDWRISSSKRAIDLVQRMTLLEKASSMMHAYAPDDGVNYSTDDIVKLINKGYTTFISGLGVNPVELANANNKLQEFSEKTRLGIPLTISSDPRNIYTSIAGASVGSEGFSQWPNPIGLAAIGDPKLAHIYGDVSRKELRSVGISVSLSPQVDLATEPRWGRIFGTFGSDSDLSKSLTHEVISGLQAGTDGLHSDSVVAVVKHFAAYGSADNGYDAIMPYSRTLSISEGNIDKHLLPFEGAFEAGVGSVMITYGAFPKGTMAHDIELGSEGGAFNKQLIQDLLRDTYRFDGVVMTDWGITRDCNEICLNGLPDGMTREQANLLGSRLGVPWGVEDLTQEERYVRAISIGVDQFGGAQDAEIIVGLVEKGLLKESLLNKSVFRIIKQKFDLGLFEKSQVDIKNTENFFLDSSYKKLALKAQSNSQVMLKNSEDLPLKQGGSFYFYGISPDEFSDFDYKIVSNPKDADVSIVRLKSPKSDDHPKYDPYFTEGNLDFPIDSEDYKALLIAKKSSPTVVVVDLNRPAILTNIMDLSDAIVGNFGSSDNAVMSVLFGKEKALGKLPFDLPSSMSDVQNQHSDIADDTTSPLFKRGYGIVY